MTIWFTSDWHLGHAAILKSRGEFAAVEAMDTAIIDQTNSVLRRGDQLWFLGDFCWTASKVGHYRQRLCRGIEFHAVQGNHDPNSLAQHCTSFHRMIFRRLKGMEFHLCHYPIWESIGRAIHLYGHCHGSSEAELDHLRPGRRAMDVGIDVSRRVLGAWRPFSIDEVLDALKEKGTENVR